LEFYSAQQDLLPAFSTEIYRSIGIVQEEEKHGNRSFSLFYNAQNNPAAFHILIPVHFIYTKVY